MIAVEALRNDAIRVDDGDDDVMVVEAGGPAMAAVDPAEVIATLAPDSLGSSLENEKVCVTATAHVAKNMSDALNSGKAVGWSSDVVHRMRVKELTQLKAKCRLPTYSVVTVGNTGAGNVTHFPLFGPGYDPLQSV
jgi:hypothetical protein